MGSWKRSGGKNAWYMIKRKIDRLLIMLSPPEVPDVGFNLQNVDDTIRAVKTGDTATRGVDQTPALICNFPGTPYATVAILQHLRDAYFKEDIFAQIEAAPNGEDGSVLAEVRDLRRYLLLVEAEIMARSNVPRTRAAPVVEQKKSPLFPWQASNEEMQTVTARGRIVAELAQTTWDSRAPGVYVLSPYLPAMELLKEVAECYAPTADKQGWIIRIDKVPPVLRDFYPNLHVERNMHEFGQLPDWQCELYVWLDSDLKYRLKNPAWHVDSN